MWRSVLVLALIGCGASSPPPASGAPADTDHDGILDAQDGCPCDAEDIDDWMDDDGCPDWDDDEDRIPDACDACPRRAERYDGVCDDDGCPEEPAVASEPSMILERVEFAPGSADIAPTQESVLIAVADAMNGSPQRGPFHVLGQVDANEPHRDGLALARARSVVAALVTQGVDASLLVAEIDPRFVTSAPHTLPRYVRFEATATPTEPEPCPPAPCTTPWQRPAPVCDVPPRDHAARDRREAARASASRRAIHLRADVI